MFTKLWRTKAAYRRDGVENPRRARASGADRENSARATVLPTWCLQCTALDWQSSKWPRLPRVLPAEERAGIIVGWKNTGSCADGNAHEQNVKEVHGGLVNRN